MLSILLLTVGCSWIIIDKDNLASSLIRSIDVSNIKSEDEMSDPDPDYVEIGDTWTGPSGTTYKLQEEDLAPGEEEYYNSWGLDCSGVWIIFSDYRK
jgi:hypothetical protein